MFSSKNPQALDTCPYNSSHRILRYRMGTHIVKCRKLHEEGSSMAVCMFNATHTIPEAELEYHLENCPDRFNFDKQVMISQDVDQTKFPIHNIDTNKEENWDEENCPSYNPEEYCKQNVILRQTKVASAATRKNFRTEERHRIQLLADMASSSATRNVNDQAPSQSGFRSVALANTTTNVNEEAPYTYEQVQHIVQSKSNYKSTVDENDQHISSSSSPQDELYPIQKEDEEFVTTHSKRPMRKGRGRGINL